MFLMKMPACKSIPYKFPVTWLLPICLALRACADTYWLDPSCPANRDWSNEIIEDAIDIAKITVRRHNMGAQDPNQARAFEYLWKKPQSDVVTSDVVSGQPLSAF